MPPPHMKSTPASTARWPLAPLVCVLAFIMTGPVAAQNAGENTKSSTGTPVWSRDAEGRVIVRATRILERIAIDGRLDEAAYRDVPAITEFIQQAPEEGAPMTERTEAW